MWAKIITIKRTKDLNCFSLCALNLFNTRVSQFELNYWNKLTFPRHSNLLRCICIYLQIMNKHIYAHMYIYIYTHTHTHTHTNTHYFTTCSWMSGFETDPLGRQVFTDNWARSHASFTIRGKICDVVWKHKKITKLRTLYLQELSTFHILIQPQLFICFSSDTSYNG